MSVAFERLTSDRPALIRRQAEADRVISATSAGHLVHEMNVERDARTAVRGASTRSRSCSTAPTFDRLAAGVIERMQMLERILADLYGPRQLVRRRRRPGRGAELDVALPDRLGRDAGAAAVADDVRRRRRRAR